MEEDSNYPNMEEINNQFSSKEQENQYLRSRNLGLQDAMEGNAMPRQDSNVIEYKLSSEELLERIEHYLKGDILKTKITNGQIETFYSVPTKKISVTFYRNEKTGIIYVVDEHPYDKEEGEWKILSILELDEEKRLIESPVEDNYHTTLMNELLEGLNEVPPVKKGRPSTKVAKKKITRLGLANKEIIDPLRINLNEYGVQEVMNILSMYITKETFLSYYKEERIYEILGDLGDALNKFFLINSKIIGLDTEYKKTKYPMIVITILHAVENAYRRALMGNENRGTREGIVISQHQPLGGGMGGFPTLPVPKKKWNLFDKSSW